MAKPFVNPFVSGQFLELRVDALVSDGRGLGRHDGVVVLVEDALPGQLVRARVDAVRKSLAEAALVEVLERSPDEQEPPCPHAGRCGGCSWQSLAYGRQLAWKERIVHDALERVGKVACPPMLPILPSPSEWGYRNKMEFSFGDEYKDGPLSLGLHKKGSTYDVLTAADCQLVHRDMNQILSCVLAYFRKWNVSYYKKMQHTGYLRHLLLRRGDTTGEILVNLVTTTQEEHDLTELKEQLLELPLEGKIVGILHILNDSLSDVVKSDETRILYGQDFFYEKLLGLQFKITPFSFFQPNSRGAEVLYETVREYIGDIENKTVFDLFSGTGTIGQVLAPVAKKVIGVEIIEEAVEAAKENALRNGLSNCKFIAGDVFKVLDEIEEKPDVIVLDPPRDGIHPKALPKILEYGVDRIVYISCKMTSLARDLEMMQMAGYRVEKMTAVDQFCETVHVESIVLLSHKSPDSKINVKVEFGEDDDKISLNAIAERAKKYQPKPKITYKMIQEYVEKKYGFKVHTAYIAEVKRSLGLTMYDASNAVEELNQPRKHPPKEKVEAIKDALKYFEVI